jgi:putative transposase
VSQHAILFPHRESPLPSYRRWYQPGGSYFFTVVTAGRLPLFNMQQAPALLGASMRLVSRDRPFETIAIVLLPDHLHCLWNLPRGDEDFSTRWRAIKAHFTRSWLAWTGLEASTTPSQVRRGYRGVW